MKPTTKSIFTLLVDNEFGVLTRVTALIRRSGWNICSLAVAETEIPERSRLTICLECRHFSLEHVLERLGTLNCVHAVTLFTEETQVTRELALFHLRAGVGETLSSLCRRYEAKVLEQDETSVFLSVVARPDELDGLVQELSGQNLVEVARTGAIALSRGEED